MTNRIRVVAIDDHAKIHMSIEAALMDAGDIQLVAHGSNGKEALPLCREHHPDVVLMDVVMPVMNGIDATQEVHAAFPQIKILALSSFQDDDAVRAMLHAGAVGYIVKTALINDLATTIRTVYSGKSILSPEIMQALLDPPAEGPTDDFGLTAREQDVLRLLVEGLNNNEIAERLIISLSTAKFHVSSIIAKLGVSNRVEAVALAVEKKLVT